MGATIGSHTGRGRVRVTDPAELVAAALGDRAPSGEFLEGYFSALNAIPSDTSPAQYLPDLISDTASFANRDDVRRVNAWLHGLYAEVGRRVAGDGIARPQNPVDWCQGFASAVDLRADYWSKPLQEQEELRELLGPILAAGTDPDAFFRDDADARNQLAAALPDIVAAAHTWMRRHPLVGGITTE